MGSGGKMKTGPGPGCLGYIEDGKTTQLCGDYL